MLPRKIGIGNSRRVYGDEAAGPPLKKLKGGSSLLDLQSEYAFFTYAPLLLYGGLNFNPIQEWINLNGHDQVVYVMQLDLPIFDMKGDPRLDRTLWAVEKEFWPDLRFHIGSLAIIDRKKKLMVRSICQEIPTIDAGALAKLRIIDGDMPTFVVTTFAVDSNVECIAFDRSADLKYKRPKLKRYSPREDTRKLAERIFAYSDNPYQGVQPLPWETTDESSNTPTAT